MKVALQILITISMFPFLAHAISGQVVNPSFSGLNDYGYKRIELKEPNNAQNYLSIMDCYFDKPKKDFVDVHYKTITNGAPRSETHVIINCEEKSFSKVGQAGMTATYVMHNPNYMRAFQIPAKDSIDEQLISYVCGTQIKKDQAAFNTEETELLTKAK